jgi:hypothetical protein
MDSLDLFKKLTSNLFFEKNIKDTVSNLSINTTKPTLQTKKEPSLKIKQIKSKSAIKNKNKKIKLKNIKLSNDENSSHIRNVHHISVVGADCPSPIENLNELFFTGFDDKSLTKNSDLDNELSKLIENFNSYDFTQLTPIQMQGIKTFN